jgi:hypothetical protein
MHEGGDAQPTITGSVVGLFCATVSPGKLNTAKDFGDSECIEDSEYIENEQTDQPDSFLSKLKADLEKMEPVKGGCQAS